MNSKTLKHWIANAMFTIAVSTLAMTAPNISYAKSSTVQVQDSYTIDELYTLIKSKYPDAEKLSGAAIGITPSALDRKFIIYLYNDGKTASFMDFLDSDEQFSLKNLNKINDKYSFGRVYLFKNNTLAIQQDIYLKGASKDYILEQIKMAEIYRADVISELPE